jgi:hypothetical protein
VRHEASCPAYQGPKAAHETVGLVPENWHIERDTPCEMVVIHRITGQTKTIKKKEE